MALQPDRTSSLTQRMKIFFWSKTEISKMTPVKDIKRGTFWAKEASLAAMSS